ncbi:MAG: diguanylate cyclase [Sphaerochaeta sp.]|nr:diguanylate cyclase [Sphaerochaeta sp.]
MPILYYIQNSSVAIILIAIILLYVKGQGGRRQAQDSLFVALLLATMAIIILELSVDILSGRTFYGSRTLLTCVTFLFYVANPLPGVVYLLYLDQLHRRWVSIPRGIGIIAFTPLVIAFILSCMSLFGGVIFSLDANNLYQRGPLFYLIIIADYLSLFLGFVYLLVYRDSFKQKDFSLFLFFPLPVLVGSILQAVFFGMEVTGISLAFTLLIVYLQMQNTQANKDYLTSLYNRSLSEQYLQYLIGHQKKTQAIGGILMDINNFKQINDTHGHDLGDKTLRIFSRLLIDSFGGDWFIGRFGGDEFILFRERATQQDLEYDLKNFQESLERFNAKQPLPFSLSVSQGSALKEPSNEIDGPSFINVLDRLMYQDKRHYHANVRTEH